MTNLCRLCGQNLKPWDVARKDVPLLPVFLQVLKMHFLLSATIHQGKNMYLVGLLHEYCL